MYRLVTYAPELSELMRWYQQRIQTDAGNERISMTQLIHMANDQLHLFIDYAADFNSNEALHGIDMRDLPNVSLCRYPNDYASFDPDMIEEYIFIIARNLLLSLVDHGWLIGIELIDDKGDLLLTFESHCPHL